MFVNLLRALQKVQSVRKFEKAVCRDEATSLGLLNRLREHTDPRTVPATATRLWPSEHDRQLSKDPPFLLTPYVSGCNTGVQCSCPSSDSLHLPKSKPERCAQRAKPSQQPCRENKKQWQSIASAMSEGANVPFLTPFATGHNGLGWDMGMGQSSCHEETNSKYRNVNGHRHQKNTRETMGYELPMQLNKL